MATKHFCDGCGQERLQTQLTQVEVRWTRSKQADQEYHQFDLDDYCLKEFKARFPINWPRVAGAER